MCVSVCVRVLVARREYMQGESFVFLVGGKFIQREMLFIQCVFSFVFLVGGKFIPNAVRITP